MTSADSTGAPGAGDHASPEELVAYALGSSLLATARREHIVTCPVCQPESAWLREVVTDLDDAPHCPEVETLVAFALGRATADEQLAAAAHLRVCEACAEEVELTRATLLSTAQEEGGLVGAVRRLVATLISPQLAPSVRGALDDRSADATTAGGIYAVGAMKISLSVEREGETLLLSGVLEGEQAQAPSSGQTHPEQVALLYRQEHAGGAAVAPLVDSKLLTPNNAFTFYDIPAGVYRLDVTQGNTVLTIESFVVSEDNDS